MGDDEDKVQVKVADNFPPSEPSEESEEEEEDVVSEKPPPPKMTLQHAMITEDGTMKIIKDPKLIQAGGPFVLLI